MTLCLKPHLLRHTLQIIRFKRYVMVLKSIPQVIGTHPPRRRQVTEACCASFTQVYKLLLLVVNVSRRSVTQFFIALKVRETPLYESLLGAKTKQKSGAVEMHVRDSVR
jgi:hypothetical protein